VIRILLRAIDRDEPMSLMLPPGVALLVGRAPDPSRLTRAHMSVKRGPDSLARPGELPDLRGLRIETVRMESRRVSANHLLIVPAPAAEAAGSEGGGVDGVSVWDLGSRNGTWLRLSPGKEVRVSHTGEVNIDLAGPTVTVDDARIARIRRAEWTSERDFGAAVVSALSDWLRQLRMQAEIIVRPRGSEDADSSGFLLADGSELQFLSPRGRTQEHLWSTASDRVRAYIHEQNALFDQLQRRVDGMIVASPASREVLKQVAEAAAQGRRTILIGPTGVGKEWLARCYHRYSQRHSGPFATLNCALLEKDLLYAQLFGARKGSFTGALTDVMGVVEAANGGTLFLDELGEMSLEVQKALLRFLDSRGEYRRLGDPHERRADVQIVCATNLPIDEPQHRLERFRDDLWYRLSSVVVRVPPLTERREDILALLQNRMLPAGFSLAEALDPAALELVLSDPWPGNFRDLENFIERLPVADQRHGIDRAACEKALRQGRGLGQTAEPDTGPVRVMPRSDAKPRRTRSGEHRLAGAALDWHEITSAALAAFLEDHGQNATGWAQLQEFFDRYMKPVFVARAAASEPGSEPGKPVNYSALARRLNIADGSTVKLQLGRYLERFRKPPGES
jgi:DNA-binding NtrC family response regulator